MECHPKALQNNILLAKKYYFSYLFNSVTQLNLIKVGLHYLAKKSESNLIEHNCTYFIGLDHKLNSTQLKSLVNFNINSY